VAGAGWIEACFGLVGVLCLAAAIAWPRFLRERTPFSRPCHAVMTVFFLSWPVAAILSAPEWPLLTLRAACALFCLHPAARRDLGSGVSAP